MKAILLHEHGGPEKLVWGDIDTPEPKEGEVRVRLRAVALNHLDIWCREGLPHITLEYPHILGSDMVGEVDGEGTRVIVNPGLSCMRCRQCLLGRDNLCRRYQILGEHVRGGYAQYICVPKSNLVPLPDGVTFTEGAAFPLTMMTAWQMLVRKARVLPGEDVVIIGASSGMGSAGVQIAKLLGARVIATATSDEKLEQARSLGADDVINTRKENLAEAIKRLTHKKGADVIFEHVGKAVWEDCILGVAWGGRIVTCGATTGPMVTTDLRHVFFRQIEILGSTMGSKGDMFDVVAHLAAGRLKPVVDRVLPLEQAAEAHRLLEERTQFGKIVLEIP